MQFTKEELNFLEMYTVCSDTKREMHDKFQIKAENGKVFFSQFSMSANLITEFDKTSSEDFSVVYPINGFFQMLKLCKDDEIIEITKDTLKFGKKSKYQFEVYDYDYTETLSMYNAVKVNKPVMTYPLVNLGKINQVKSFIGNLDELQYIRFDHNCFISSDKDNVIAVAETDNKSTDVLFLSKVLLGLVNLTKIEKIDLSLYENEDSSEKFFSFNIDKTYIVFNEGDCIIPDIFEDEFKKLYDHKDKVEVNRSELLSALQRIKVMALGNLESRIFLNFSKDKLKIESKDRGYALEEVDAKVDAPLEGFYIIVSVIHLSSIVNSIESDKVIFKISTDREIPAISIVNEDDTQLYINNLYEDLDMDE